MGTGKSGRYLNTRGSGRSVSDYALVHFLLKQERFLN